MSCVLFKELESVYGLKIGIATLNSEKSLNALNMDMIQLLTPQLEAWQKNDDIALVVLEGAGEKSFCAGGDVVSLYKAMATEVDSKSDPDNYIESFFSAEYKLDYLIHRFEKPILLWGNGIIMGGGLGLMAGASHKVVTETARIAMPEITIGLYPDVGGSYFLNKMPDQVGLFLGLTGASMNSEDARFVGLADYFIKHSFKSDLIEKLLLTKWGKTKALNHDKLSEVLQGFQNTSGKPPISEVKKHIDLISKMSKHNALSDKVNYVLNIEIEDKWFNRAQKGLNHGSPLSAHLVFQQLKHADGMSLGDCFRQELSMSVQCGRFGEFQEGVRALLIDKDGKPNWKYPDLNSVPDEQIAPFFESIWAKGQHPLQNLGKD
ncbi:enoyl-CoA hydratase/isomerase family protein [Pseudoalteromonas denitrificans]|uniref:3-hydroxyisobutyryl-CoA hydrolase n=1 Tax=Pseudoalteromonas denitrificans DSM 6059 TaxID=1123010 RepID=A0A1I1MA95_9GAMM|nr:enoyl-CoA hydratase/isomerase family protein [Pseudoalteromonas denitrificans]SFC78570.1 Enoyl-CoA hydratase/carnithine racemase [Pseudoalteromonas denitrificans DSM 6059]